MEMKDLFSDSFRFKNPILEDHRNSFVPVSRHQVNHATVPYSQISVFIENQGGGVGTLIRTKSMGAPV